MEASKSSLSPSRSPRPLARPSPKKKFELASKDAEVEMNETVEPINEEEEQKVDFEDEEEEDDKLFSLTINDPFMFDEDSHWPSEDRASRSKSLEMESMQPSDPGFTVYKEAQARLLEFGFSHNSIEGTLLEVMKDDSGPRQTNEIVMTCLNKLLAIPTLENTVKEVEKPKEDTSKDITGMLTLVLWTVGSLRARLKRQPNPQIPGFPTHLRHAWTGLDPGRDALGKWLRAKTGSEEEAARVSLQHALSATLIFTEENSSMGSPPHLSNQGQERLLEMLTNAADGLSNNGRARRMRMRRSQIILDVNNDHSLLAVWERVNAQLNALYKKEAQMLKNVAAAAMSSSVNSDNKSSHSAGAEKVSDVKVETFASKAADDLKCAVCWDDLNPPSIVGEASNKQNVQDEEDPTVLCSNSDVVKMPQCGHTLCAECAYQWLKSNITSGRLSGDAMRCPLANVSADNGGHGLVGGGSTAAELEKNEVESLIFLTAKVGENVELEEQKAARIKAQKAAEAKKQAEQDQKEHDVVNAFAAKAMEAMGRGLCSNSRINFASGGHPLQPFEVSAKGYRCDSLCRKTILPGSQMFSCRACNYDLCFDCAAKSVSMKMNMNLLLGQYLVAPPSLSSSSLTFEESMDIMIEADTLLDLPDKPSPLSAIQESPSEVPASPSTPRFAPSDPKHTTDNAILESLNPLSLSSPTVGKYTNFREAAKNSSKGRFVLTSTFDDGPIALLFLQQDEFSKVIVEKLKQIYPFDSGGNGLLDGCEIVVVQNEPNETPFLSMNIHRRVEKSKLCAKLQVKSYPTLIFYNSAREVLQRFDRDDFLNGALERFDPLTFELNLASRFGVQKYSTAVNVLFVDSKPLIITEENVATAHTAIKASIVKISKKDVTFKDNLDLLLKRADVARDVVLQHLSGVESGSTKVGVGDGSSKKVLEDKSKETVQVTPQQVRNGSEVAKSGAEEEVPYNKSTTTNTTPPVINSEVNNEGTGNGPPLLLLKYHKFLANREAERIPGTRWCFKPGCETAILPTQRRATRRHLRGRNRSTSHDHHLAESVSRSDIPKQSLGPPALLYKCGESFLNGLLRCFMGLLDCLLRCIGLENVCGGPGSPLVCPTCESDVCARCGREWHGAWASCDAVTDLTLQEFRKEKFLQPCPNCRREVEKIDACPHMSCPCGHQWCWVCRGNFPCANLHFGKGGYGSSIEIGDVRGIQRLAVVARMISTCCFFPLFALFIGTGSFVWGCVLLVTTILLCCFGCWKRIADIDNKTIEKKLRPMVYKFERKAEKVGKVLSYACTGFPIIIGVCCALSFIVAVIVLLHVLGIIFIPVCIWFISADLGMWFKIRYNSAKRLWKEQGCLGVLRVFSEENKKIDLFQSALDTRFEVIDIVGASIIGRIFQGKPSAKFMSKYNPAKGGHLNHKHVVFGRRAMACTLFALMFPPTFALGVCLAPLAPFFILPLVFYPRDPIPKHLAPLISPLVGAMFFALFAYLLPSWSHSIDQVFSPSEVGYLPALYPAIAATVMAWLLLRSPALSSCACCAPAWLLAYSVPLSLLIGKNNARQYLAFSPVPDMPLQLPTMFIMIFVEHLME